MDREKRFFSTLLKHMESERKKLSRKKATKREGQKKKGLVNHDVQIHFPFCKFTIFSWLMLESISCEPTNN